ncbi:MAG: hypothetical protein ACP5RN_11280 [Armatimonadota bacterium]
MKTTRREFLRLSFLLAPALAGCGGADNAYYQPPQPDFWLTGSEEQIAEQTRMAVQFAVNSQQGVRPVTLGAAGQIFRIEPTEKANVIRLSRWAAGKTDQVTIRWALDGMSFDNRQGVRLSSRGITDWIRWGVKSIVLLLIVWLGASVAKFIMAAIATVAFYLLLAAILVTAVGIALELIKLTGLTWDDVTAFVQMTITAVVNLLREVVNSVSP